MFSTGTQSVLTTLKVIGILGLCLAGPFVLARGVIEDQVDAQRDAVAVQFGGEHLQVGHAAAHVHGHDTFGAGSDGAAYGSRIKGKGQVHIYQYGNGSDAEHGFEAGHESESRHDHFITGADAKNGQCRR